MHIPKEVHASLTDEIVGRDTLGYDAPSDDDEGSSESDEASTDGSDDDSDD
jgi:hypothetical protein